jgi:hypothetical protein
MAFPRHFWRTFGARSQRRKRRYLQVPAARLSFIALLQYLPQNLPPALVQLAMHFSSEQPKLSAEAVETPAALHAMNVVNAIAIKIRNMSTPFENNGQISAKSGLGATPRTSQPRTR